jgi:hypothetical protein
MDNGICLFVLNSGCSFAAQRQWLTVGSSMQWLSNNLSTLDSIGSMASSPVAINSGLIAAASNQRTTPKPAIAKGPPDHLQLQ